jgi:hypothetical protein
MGPALLIALAVSLCGEVAGASDVGLVEAWRAPGAGGKPFKRILAAGLTADAPARRKFEDHFVTILRAREVACLTSYSIVPDLSNPGEPGKVTETLLGQQVDGAITVRLVPLEDATEEQWAAAWQMRLKLPVRARDYVEESLRNRPGDVSRFGVEVTLWEVATGERVWAGRIGENKIGKLRKAAASLVEDVTNELIHAGLL